jgi:hypothetical protein
VLHIPEATSAVVRLPGVLMPAVSALLLTFASGEKDAARPVAESTRGMARRLDVVDRGHVGLFLLAAAIFGDVTIATHLLFQRLPAWAFILNFLFPLMI